MGVKYYMKYRIETKQEILNINKIDLTKDLKICGG